MEMVAKPCAIFPLPPPPHPASLISPTGSLSAIRLPRRWGVFLPLDSM